MESSYRLLWESAGGLVPNHWIFCSIESLLKDSKAITVGVMYPGGSVNDGVPLVRVADVKNGMLLEKPSYLISNEVNNKYKKTQLDGSELLITLVGNPGDCVVVNEDMKGWNVARALAVLRLKDPSLREWLRSILLSSPAQHQISSRLNTTVQKTLNLKDIKEIAVPIPPLSERLSITASLKILDDKIELNRQMNETLEAMAQALFKSWFVDFDPVIDNALLAGKAIPESLKEHADMRQAQLESGKAKTNSEINDLFPSEFEFTEKLGWIPKGWSVLKFREITEAKQGKYLPSKEMQDQQDENYHFPVWGGNGIRGYSEEYIYEEPVVVMTCRGSNCGLLKITDEKSWITNTSFACKPKVGSTFFLYQYFSHDDFSSCISGSAQPQITYTALENKIMPFPISEKTVQRASEWLQILRNRQLSTLKQNETLAKLRDTLLPKLMSGELRIADAEKLVADI